MSPKCAHLGRSDTPASPHCGAAPHPPLQHASVYPSRLPVYPSRLQVTSPGLKLPVQASVYPSRPQYTRTGCVITPLGSPTVSPKRSYVHVPEVPRTVAWCSAGHERGVRWVLGGWCSTRYTHPVPTHWPYSRLLVLPGPNHCK